MLYTFMRVCEDYLRKLFNTFWFLPTLVSLLGPLLAFLFLELDQHLSLDHTPFLFHEGTAEADMILHHCRFVDYGGWTDILDHDCRPPTGFQSIYTASLTRLLTGSCHPDSGWRVFRDFCIFAACTCGDPRPDSHRSRFLPHAQCYSGPWSWFSGIGTAPDLRSSYWAGDLGCRHCCTHCRADAAGD